MRPLHSLNDDCLVPLVISGDSAAFEEVYNRYHVAIYDNINRIIKDSAATEDLVQETFFIFWKQKNRIKAGKSLAGWLFVISYNQSVNWLRRKLVESKAKKWFSFQFTETENLHDYDAQMEILETAISQLPPQKKRVLELCKLQGFSYKEAAKEMNISSHTVKEYLSGAMKVVREYTISHPEYKALLPLLFGLFY